MGRPLFRAILALTFVVFLTTILESQARQPRTAASPLLPELVHVDRLPRKAPVPATAPTDTLYLLGGPETLSGKFQDEGGGPDRQGWTGVDVNQATEVHWQVSTFNAAELDPGTPDNHAWWCGDFYESCDVDDPEEGYGDNWYEFLDWYGTVPDPGANVTVRVQAVINYDIEPGEDFLVLRVSTSSWMEELQSFTYRDTAQVVDVSIILTPEDFVGESGDQVHLRWDFHSDGAWSDEDCRWPTAGAAQIDLIRVFFDQGGGEIQVGTTETCEAGDPLQWLPTAPRGPGEFSKVWPLLDDADPASVNNTPQFAFIDDGVVVPGTGGYPCTTWCYGPGGYIVNPDRGLAELYVYIHNEIWSPVLAVPSGNWAGAEFAFDEYVHAELDNGGAYTIGHWHIRSTADPDGLTAWTEWRDRNYVYWGSPRYVRQVQNVTDLLVPGATHVQLALGVMNYNGTISNDGTPAPYYDNVSFKVYESQGPRALLVRADGSGEYLTIQAAINAAADHDTVLLADGVYTGEGNRDIYYLGKEITVRSESGNPRDCVIDAEGAAGDNHRGFDFAMEEGPGSVLAGLTIVGGYRDPVSSHVFYSGGAIICRSGSSPTIDNCVFRDNHALGNSQRGGAIYCDDASPRITGCVFDGNTAIYGGAVGAAGLSSPVISDCLFVGNESLSFGGGMYADGADVHITISSCTFNGNRNPANSGTLVSAGHGRFDIDHTILAFGGDGYAVSATGAEDFQFSCSNLHGHRLGDWDGFIAAQLGVDGNISLDPDFCRLSNPGHPYRILESSPCAPDFNPACGLIGSRPVGCGSLSEVEVLPSARPRTRFHPCYPNPFNPGTTMKFSLVEPEMVDLAIYDLKGQLVKRLVSGRVAAGEHEARWDGRDGRGASLASGVYFARFVAGPVTRTQRLVLIR